MLKIGDHVRLPSVKPVNAESGNIGWNHEMDTMLGKTMLVEEVGRIAVKVGSWWWEFGWIQKIDARAAHRDSEMGEWKDTEKRIRERRDAQFRKIFGG